MTPSRRLRRRSLAACATLAAGLALGACGDDDEDAGATASADKPAQAEKAAYPVTIENCGNTLTFDKAPSRAVLTYFPLDETFVALGLGDRAIGRVSPTEKRLALPRLPDQEALIEKIPVVNEKFYPPPREKLLTLRSDFLLAFSEGDYSEKGLATYGELTKSGVKVYTVVCPDGGPGGGAPHSLADTQRTILDLGKIFGVPERAEKVVGDIRRRIADVGSEVAGRPPVKALAYYQGTGPLELAGGLTTEMLDAAGLENVFPKQKTYFEVSLEEAAANPADAFVVFPFPGAEGAPFLFRKFPNMPASKNRRSIQFLDHYVSPGSIRHAEGVEVLARKFHPEAFAGNGK